MINSVKSRHCCSDNSDYTGGVAPHTHDDRYYTESEIDSKLQQIKQDTDTLKTQIPLIDLQKVTAVNNTTDKGIKLANGRLKAEFRQLLGSTADTIVESYNDKDLLGVNNLVFTPQDTNFHLSKSVLTSRLRNSNGSLRTSQLELIVNDGGGYARFNTPVFGIEGVEDNHFVTKKQLTDTLDFIVEYGDNA